MNTRVHGKVLSLSQHAIVIFEQLILFFKHSFSANVFHGITGFTDALKKNALDQNEQIIQLMPVNLHQKRKDISSDLSRQIFT